MPSRRLGEGRVVVGLHERIERRNEAIRDLENTLSQVRLLLGKRDTYQPAAILDQIEKVVFKNDD